MLIVINNVAECGTREADSDENSDAEALKAVNDKRDKPGTY